MPSSAWCANTLESDMKNACKLLLLITMLASCTHRSNDRTIPLKGIENGRELGGLVMQDGRSILYGKLVRSGNLSKATDKDIAILKDRFHLSDVYDFRFDQEAEADPDRVIEGVTITRLSTLPQAFIDGFSSGRADTTQVKASDFMDALAKYAFDPRAQQMAKKLYPAIVMDSLSQNRYGAFLKGVLNAEGGVLWHCSQGKDRAGWGTAFVLAALGASRETIVEDFNQSNVFYEPYVKTLSARIKEMGGGDEELAFISAMVGVSVENFENTLDLIDAQYGSLNAYLEKALGFTAQEQKQLRNKYLNGKMITVGNVLEDLKGRDVVLFVADEDEINPAEVPFPVVFTGMGKMRMFSALVKWHEALPEGSNPVVLNIGSAGSAKYPIGTIVNCTRIFNGGSDLIADCIELARDGASIFSGDYFMSTQTFSPEQVKTLSEQYDLFDMEAYAAAQFCKMYDIPFYCLKAVSDNLDGNLKDWRSILSDIRVQFTSLLNSCK